MRSPSSAAEEKIRPLGGSPAPRGLLEDLALRGPVRVGPAETAETVARRRLRRRPTAFDQELSRSLSVRRAR